MEAQASIRVQQASMIQHVWVGSDVCIGLSLGTHARTHARTQSDHSLAFGSAALRNSVLIEKVLQRYPKAITMASQLSNRIKVS